MKRGMYIGMFTLYFAATAMPAMGNELKYALGGCSITDVTIIDKAGGVTIGHNKSRGVTHSIPAGNAFDNMSFECQSTWNASKAGVEFEGRCTFIDKDGDRVFGVASKTDTAMKGWNWKYLGGSGKWEGLSGGGTSKYVKRLPKIRPGVNTGCWEARGTYALAK